MGTWAWLVAALVVVGCESADPSSLPPGPLLVMPPARAPDPSPRPLRIEIEFGPPRSLAGPQADKYAKAAADKKAKENERAQHEANRDAEKAKAGSDKATRTAFADKLEGVFLDQGMDATVRASGTTLKITYVLCNRAFVHQLVNGNGQERGPLWTIDQMGFKRIVCSDGFYSASTMDL